MSEYKRNVAYLMEYDEASGGGATSVGFVRTRINGDEGRILVGLTDAGNNQNVYPKNLKWGYYIMDGENVRICCYRPVEWKDGTMEVTFHPDNLEGAAWDEVDGIILKNDYRVYYGAWKRELRMERARYVETFRDEPEEFEERKEPQETRDLQVCSIEEKPANHDAESYSEFKENIEIPEFLKTHKKERKSRVKYEDSYYMKITDWKDLFKKKDMVEPFSDDEIFSCIELNAEEIKYLPSTCSNALKNSFLLHGLYYYNHVLVGKYRCKKRQKIYVLGIPGTYDNVERMMAVMYGFDRFKVARRDGIRTSEFGYWYAFFRDDEE